MNTLEAVGNLVAEASLRSSALIVCVLLLRWCLGGKLPAQCFACLWILVGVRLLLFVAPTAPWSAFNFLRVSSPDSVASHGAQWRTTVDSTDESLPISVAPSLPPERKPLTTSVAHSLSWAGVLSSVWLLGVLIQGGWLVWQGLRLRGALADSLEINDPRIDEMERMCRDQLGLRRRVRLFETAAVASPAVCGFLRPKLLLPIGLLRHLSADELRFVLLHELAHVRRGDLLVLWLLAVARALHWFNPLVWLAVRAAQTDLETACDERVLRGSREAVATDYGATLVRVAQHFSARPAVLPLAGIVGSRDALKHRIQRILAYTPPNRWSAGLAILLVMMLGAVFGADEKLGARDSGAAVSPPAVTAPSAAEGTAREHEPSSAAPPSITDNAHSFAKGWAITELSVAQRGTQMIPHVRVRRPDGQEFVLFGTGASREGVTLAGVDWSDPGQPRVRLQRGAETTTISLTAAMEAQRVKGEEITAGWKVTGISVPARGEKGAATVTIETGRGVTMSFIDLEKNATGIFVKVIGLDAPAAPLEVVIYRGDDPIGKLAADRAFVTARAADPAAAPQVVLETTFLELTRATAEKLGLFDGKQGPGEFGSLPTHEGAVLGGVFLREKAESLRKRLVQQRGVDVLVAPKVTTRSGQRALLEIVREIRYQSEWERVSQKPVEWAPTAWETGKCGVTLAITPKIGDGGILDLELEPSIVEFLGFVDYETKRPLLGKGRLGKLPKPVASFGPLVRSDQAFFRSAESFPKGRRTIPIFTGQKVTTSISIYTGQTVVLHSRSGIHPADGQSPFGSPIERFTFLFVETRLLEEVTPKAASTVP